MRSSGRSGHIQDWVSLAAAVGLGPAFLLIGYQIPGLVFAASAGAWILLCAVVVTLLTAFGRPKLLVWQVAVTSITLAVIGDNIQTNVVQRNEILSTAYVFWAGGTLLSSPLPIYLVLKPLAPSKRFIFAMVIGVIALTLWVGIKKITG
ncbi:MAG: hypothetical protein WBV69_03570 [Candidatus Sulfotelmatobacter sp.]